MGPYLNAPQLACRCLFSLLSFAFSFEFALSLRIQKVAIFWAILRHVELWCYRVLSVAVIGKVFVKSVCIVLLLRRREGLVLTQKEGLEILLVVSILTVRNGAGPATLLEAKRGGPLVDRARLKAEDALIVLSEIFPFLVSVITLCKSLVKHLHLFTHSWNYLLIF